jgi:Kef-type K+ transport system membrane component KefB
LLGPALVNRPWIFNLFFATALSISALPVIAKTLLDLGLYKTDVGLITMASAFIDDLLGWLIFAFVLSLLGGEPKGFSIGATLIFALSFVIVMLIFMRPLLNRLFAWARERLAWPSTALWMTVALGLMSAALTEWLGVHALFGAFIAGVAVGDSALIDVRTKETLEQFTHAVLAPIFFALIGLKVNFAANFDVALVLSVLVIASLGKILGCGLAGIFSGLPRRRAWAIGVAMNARGAMVIVIGLVALERGVISEAFFVTLVALGLLTSMISGPLMSWILGSNSTAKGKRMTSKRMSCPSTAK